MRALLMSNFTGFENKADGPSGRGLPGSPGVTPHIGPNGDWFIGTTDTGVSAKGESDGRAVVAVSQSGNVITFQHADGAKHSITVGGGGSPVPAGLQGEITDLENKLSAQGLDVAGLKSQLGTLSHHVDSLSGVYSYRGTTAPQSYPKDAKPAYFLNIHNSQSSQIAKMPNPDDKISDGAVYFLNNENDSSTVTINSIAGESIDKATHANVGPLQFRMLVKNGNEWVTTATGYIPSNLSDLTHRVLATVSDQLHTKQQILDIINQWIANPTTKGLLDHIITQLGYAKGSGDHPKPSEVKIHYGTGDDYPTSFTSETGEFAPHQPLVVNNLDKNPKKVWIAVPDPYKSKVTGISANNGLAALWQSKNIAMDGKQWTVFISPTALADDHISFSIKWSV